MRRSRITSRVERVNIPETVFHDAESRFPPLISPVSLGVYTRARGRDCNVKIISKCAAVNRIIDSHRRYAEMAGTEGRKADEVVTPLCETNGRVCDYHEYEKRSWKPGVVIIADGLICNNSDPL